MDSKKNFFISYTKADAEFAKWVAWQLEAKGYTTVIQAWDFKPGTNFINNMDKALKNCEKLIAIISPDYFKSLSCQAEWTAAFTKDPSGEKGLLIPVRVRECKPEGLLAPIVYIDIFDVEEKEAAERLLDGISTERPKGKPVFPGGSTNKPNFPGKLPFNNLPFRKNVNFTGREDILYGIRDSFEQGQYTSLTQAVSGLGGVGKTQIALEYAFRYGHLYGTIWWVNAEDSQSLMVSYSSFAYKNGLVGREVTEKDIILEAVWNWMSGHENWLFIYDNAEDVRMLDEYLPRMVTGHILITSRYTNWSGLGEVLPVDVFNAEEAENFFIKRTGIADRKSAAMLADALGYLPLALEQAAVYIAENKITYEKYLDMFNEYKIGIFEEDGYSSNSYNSTVAVTWNISIRKIGGKSSEQLLNICSFFAPYNIDRQIFTESSKYLPEPLSSEVLNDLKYNRLISGLAQYSLIKLQDGKLSIHRLLQEVIRQSVDKKYWLGCCINILYELCHFDYNNRNTWDKFSGLIPHALSIARHSDEVSVELEKVAFIYNEAASWLSYNAVYKEAEPLYIRALEIRKEVLGADHPSTATSLNNLALLYHNQGRYKEAEPLYKRAIEICEKALGANQPDTANSLNNLALLCYNQGRYEEAEPLNKRAIEIFEKVLGTNHPSTAASLNNLALLCYNQGRYEEAEPLYKRAIEICEKALGANHPDTATSLNNLTLLYHNQGRYEEAEPLYKRAIEICEKVLGENHPNTATFLNNLALLYNNQGRYEEAEPLYIRALEICEKALGANHPDTATSLNNLAGLYDNQGRYKEAEPLYKRAIEIYEKALGANHPDTATSLNNLAGLYDNQGSMKKLSRYIKGILYSIIQLIIIINDEHRK